MPITGQTFAVLLVGASLGASRGAISLGLYALFGALGAPIFAPNADGSHTIGLHAFTVTGGYIVGFIAAAALVGWLAQLKWDHNVVKTFVSFAAGTVVIYAIGLPWLAVALHLNLSQTLYNGLWPFLITDAIKALLAALILPLSWRLIARADHNADERAKLDEAS